MSKRSILGLVLAALLLVACAPSRGKSTFDALGWIRSRSPGGTAAAPAPPAESSDISIRAAGRRVPVIMYHDVIERRGRGSVWFDVTTQELEEQFAQLQAQGYTPISVEDLRKSLVSDFAPPEKAVVLTFDDNYQGVFDRAYPLLKRYGYPAAIFVHTAYVGKTQGGRQKMDWPTLQTLSRDPLITIGSHTVTHPDLTTIGPEEQRTELEESKRELEARLGKPVDFLAYPDGKSDESVQALSRAAGYKLAFGTDNGLAEESPSILNVNRYVHTRLAKALADRDAAAGAGAVGLFRAPLAAGSVVYTEQDYDGVRLAMVSGGTPETVMSSGREGVSQFVQRTPGGVAGINGTFFAMAAVAATDNQMIGPIRTPESSAMVPDLDPTRQAKLRNRPLVVWGPREIAFAPYNPARTNDEAAIAEFMPDAKNVFLAGAWLVHGGVAITGEQMRAFAGSDVMDPRRRVAFGVTGAGAPFGAVSKGSVSSEQFARALATAGAQEAVLLDSGFSASLVYDGKILASGHSTPDNPSRPVPHAIVFKGEADPASVQLVAQAEPATSPDAVERPRRRRARRHR